MIYRNLLLTINKLVNFLLYGIFYILKKYNEWFIYDIHCEKTKLDFYVTLLRYIVFETFVIFYIIQAFLRPTNSVLNDLLLLPIVIPVTFLLTLNFFHKVTLFAVALFLFFAFIVSFDNIWA